MSKTVHCVEDERFILNNHRRILTDNGYAVLTAETVAEAQAHLAAQAPDAVVLDIMLPDGNGLRLHHSGRVRKRLCFRARKGVIRN